MSREGSFGSFLRKRRIEVGLSLRAFCKLAGEYAGNLSKIERGRLAPPDSVEKLEKYAKALGITGSDEIRDFLDLARISRGEIPEDILTKDELVNVLPLVFRTVRGQKVKDDDLEKLADLIRNT
ncbi:MAG: helix-turn-helix domain-containing protein [Candidatus Aegiribacteria sp.]|nr:helix-turn-helix domain-containing protein [Candidatus Aegiribacteria sp.]